MAISPTQRPDDGGAVSGTDPSRAWSGTPDRGAADPTNLAGQYPPGSWGNALFGGPQPMGSGAPGTQGARYTAASDPTNEPGQLYEGLSGLGPADTANSGAPGMTTNPNTAGGAAIVYTIPGAGSSGTHHQAVVRDDLAGYRDSTQANDEGYASGGPQLPGIAGNEPSAAAGRGSWQPDLNGTPHVMRGGRDIKPGRSSNR